MIAEVFTVIGPVVILIAVGFFAVKLGAFPLASARAVMFFAQNFAVPLILFDAIRRLDFAAHFQPEIIWAYFVPAFATFAFGIFLSRRFGRGPQSSVVLGFNALFSNSVIIGLPLAERAYGTGSLFANFTVIAFHSPLCYLAGAIAMEIARPHQSNILGTIKQAARELARNPLIIAIFAGVLVNFTGIGFPVIVEDALTMQKAAALPAALFALGGVLSGLKIGGDLPMILSIGALRMLLAPLLVLVAALLLRLDTGVVKSIVLVAAMPTGTNGFIFAAIYGREEETASSIVFFTTVAAMILVPMWLVILSLL